MTSRFVAVFLCCLALTGCFGSRKTMTPKPQAVRTKTIAVMPLASATVGAAGQEAADLLALKLMDGGHVVVDRSRANAIVSDRKFYESGLNDEVRGELQAQNIAAVVFGNVTEYGCETRKTSSFFDSTTVKNRCSVALTVKMADTATGNLLWGAVLKDSREGADFTAADLMRSLIQHAASSGILPPPLTEPEPAKAPESAKAPQPARPAPAK